jgi:hypothetical protein
LPSDFGSDRQEPDATVSGDAALARSKSDQISLACENFNGEFPAVFTGHRPLDEPMLPSFSNCSAQ